MGNKKGVCQNIVVEIHESKFSKRKYNRRHTVKGGLAEEKNQTNISYYWYLCQTDQQKVFSILYSKKSHQGVSSIQTAGKRMIDSTSLSITQFSLQTLQQGVIQIALRVNGQNASTAVLCLETEMYENNFRIYVEKKAE